MPPGEPLCSVFLALPLQGQALDTYRALQERLQVFRSLRLQPQASAHLTLYFWPTVLPLELTGIREAIGDIARDTPPFRLRLEAIDVFGATGSERVLYWAVPFSEPLARLKKRCPWPNPRQADGTAESFRPHVTLARVAHCGRFQIERKSLLRTLGNPVSELPVDTLRLYARVEGRSQTALHSWTLGHQSSSVEAASFGT